MENNFEPEADKLYGVSVIRPCAVRMFHFNGWDFYDLLVPGDEIFVGVTVLARQDGTAVALAVPDPFMGIEIKSLRFHMENDAVMWNGKVIPRPKNTNPMQNPDTP